MKVTNLHDVSLPLAVWLMYDDYDYVNEKKYISATSLLKPIKYIVMQRRVDTTGLSMDVMDKVATVMGSGLHGSIENAWYRGHKQALLKLGYPKRVVDSVVINPTPEDFATNPDLIPVYIEQRGIKEIAGWKVGGKFDIVTEGLLQDFKSTTAYTWMYGGRDEDYKMQGSIYKWLHPDKITQDIIRINFIFTDWQKVSASNPAYPPHRIMHKDVTLLSVPETEAWVSKRLSLIDKYWDAPESEIPECTDEELWISDPVFKYYAKPESAQQGGKSTRNFTSMIDARKFQAEKGGKGVIITIQAEPKRCGYCPIASICKQRERYF